MLYDWCMSLCVCCAMSECFCYMWGVWLHAGLFVCGLLGCVLGMSVVMLVALLVCVWCVLCFDMLYIL